MNKISLEKIKRCRQPVAQMHEDLKDYLDVLQAQRRSLDKKTYAQTEMEKRYVAE